MKMTHSRGFTLLFFGKKNLNFQSHDSYFVEFAPTTIHEKNFAYVENSKFAASEAAM